jgi:hypothetical protein
MMLIITELHAKSVELRHRAESVLHKVADDFSLAWISLSSLRRSSDELAGAIGALVLCAILLLVTLGISSVTDRS